ncbi:hypothetical protein SODALDRAFT_334368 [Sodiomyces alkalinus F11]|uniref:HMG box domain-containing protein n=1 Tax=Sodiomyces alkalinus (strain CBS 110278 / VKM F-3762 / F11) TaxID=1314773 RepID=A0A3N2PRZ3_SODAK|nr:hypothetical protein SODALDRAFT_334368 [Sodiomyces alkalinus F11]ROT37282.1 hypothetical protein SODALDRAFT_334368 [Sodiomyces alkalinus F11]
MLTAIGRVAAARVLARSNLKLLVRTTTATTAAPFTYLKPTPARSFTTTQWTRAADEADDSTKSGASKKATKSTASQAAKKAAKPKSKPKPKRKPKKKAAKKRTMSRENQLKLEIRHLKAATLQDAPKKLPQTAWTVYTSEGIAQGMGAVTERMKQLSIEYKSLSSSELERLQEKADENKTANHEAYKAWLQQHDPETIYAANAARARLDRLLPEGRYKSYRTRIRDPRLPKRPRSAYTQFSQERWATGNLTGSPPELAKEIAAEYKALPASEKQKYIDLAEVDRERYVREMEIVLNKKVKSRSATPPSP